MATKTPNFISVYLGLDRGEERTLAKEAIEAAGGAFTVGTVVASLYHFAKALRKEKTLIAGVNAARAYGPRFGGTFALVLLPVDITRYAMYRFRGGGPRSFDDSCLGDLACWAAIGALLRAPRGLGSALRAAVVWGSVPGAITALHYCLENSHLYNPQRPYSYPHYRLQQQQQDN